jgi:hypothetical protein
MSLKSIFLFVSLSGMTLGLVGDDTAKLLGDLRRQDEHVRAASASAQESDRRQWGEASGGVQMAVEDAGFVGAGVRRLRVTFRNLRDEEVNLYLGVVGGAGVRPCKLDPAPAAPCDLNFGLDVTDAAGKTRKLTFSGIYYVAGRLDPCVVRLGAGSTYTLEVSTDQFWSPDAKEWGLRLSPGRYHLALEFEGRTPGHVNLDQQYIKQLSFWQGKLTSNSLAVEW